MVDQVVVVVLIQTNPIPFLLLFILWSFYFLLCVCMHGYVSMFLCVHTCTLHVRVCAHLYVYVHVCVHMYACVCTCVHVCMIVCVCACIRTCKVDVRSSVTLPLFRDRTSHVVITDSARLSGQWPQHPPGSARLLRTQTPVHICTVLTGLSPQLCTLHFSKQYLIVCLLLEEKCMDLNRHIGLFYSFIS